MSKNKQISPVPSVTLRAFRSKSDDIVRLATRWILQDPEQAAVHGESAERKISAGLRFTTLALQTSMFIGNTKLLEFQLDWANERLPNDMVQPDHLLANLKSYAKAVDEILSAGDSRAVNEYVYWMIERQDKWLDSAARRTEAKKE